MNTVLTRSAEETALHKQPGNRSSANLKYLQVLLLLPALIFGLEGLFGLAGIGEQEYLRRDSLLGFAPMENKTMTWRKEGFARTQFNSYGMRDIERTLIKPPNVYRIAVIGDSYVESLQVDRNDSFCAKLEKRLSEPGEKTKVEVLNFGVSAYNLGQMMLRTENLALKFQPDMVLLVVRTHTSRQLPQNPNGGFLWARPSFTLNKDGQLITDYGLQKGYMESSEGKRAQLLGWIRQHSRIWGVVSLCVEQVAAWWDKVSHPRFDLAAAAAKKTAFDQQSPHGSDASLQQTSKLLSEKCAISVWPVADAIITRMKNSCNDAGARFCIVRLPGARGDINREESRLLANSAKQLNVPYCDMTPVLERAVKKGDAEKIWYIGHFAPMGHDLIADELLPFLKLQMKETRQQQR